MYLFRIFRSFLPLHNPIGFGASDLVILALAVLLVGLLPAVVWLAPYAREIAKRPPLCMALLFGLVVLLRLALWPHNPWAGVLLASGLFCALCYWMLRGWVTPLWAFAGGLLALMQFGPLCAWTNTYSGGALSASAGCLVLGSLPRLRKSPRRRYGLLIGAGLGLEFLTRPFEAVLACLLILLGVIGLERLPSRYRRYVFVLCCASFVFWFGIYWCGDSDVFPLTAYQNRYYVH